VGAALGETWLGVDRALNSGGRGLRGGTTLARLLHERRGAPHQRFLPRLSVAQILSWADAHHVRTGAWPIADDMIVEATLRVIIHEPRGAVPWLHRAAAGQGAEGMVSEQGLTGCDRMLTGSATRLTATTRLVSFLPARLATDLAKR
jgi:hypothetical protein